MSIEAKKPGFAVLDFETNGLGPWEDILEIGVVLLDSDLNVELNFGTLVDNRKRVKNPWAHGIDNPQLVGAPTEEVAFLHLLSLLSGRYVVAHNARFEKRFLDYHGDAFGLTGSDTVDIKLIDTMPIGQELCGKRKLTDISSILNIPHNAHTALSDAQVTAVIIQQAYAKNSKAFAKQLAEASVWPERFKEATVLPSIHRITADELFTSRSEWLTTLPYGESNDAELALQYKELVWLYSLNFDLSANEKAELAKTVAELQLDRATVTATHQQVLNEMLSVKFPSALLSHRSYLLTNLANNLGFTLSSDELKSNGDATILLENGHKLMLSGRLSENQHELTRTLKRKGFEITKQVDEADVVVIGYKDSTNKQIRDAQAKRTPVIAELSLLIFLG